MIEKYKNINGMKKKKTMLHLPSTQLFDITII